MRESYGLLIMTFPSLFYTVGIQAFTNEGGPVVKVRFIQFRPDFADGSILWCTGEETGCIDIDVERVWEKTFNPYNDLLGSRRTVFYGALVKGGCDFSLENGISLGYRVSKFGRLTQRESATFTR